MNPLKTLLSIAALWLWLGAIAHAGTVTYVYSDPQGTPLAEADANGTITATFDYRPYGVQTLGTAPNGPGYTGHVNDPDTGLVYMQARYYDPAVGRFLSVDPAGPSAGGVFDFNRFAYVDNNPVVRIDPDGRVSAATDAAAERQRHASDEVKKGRARAESGSLAEKEAGIGAFLSGGSGGEFLAPVGSPNVTYKKGVPNATGAIEQVLECTANVCSDVNIVVTSTSENIPQHKPGTPHRRGEAVDLRVVEGEEGHVLTCAAVCGAKFGLNERAHPSAHATGAHVHFQTGLGRFGGQGDMPSLLPPPFTIEFEQDGFGK